MATLKEKIAAEHSVRELLAQEALPPPDCVEYGQACIRLLWNEPKLALVIDIDDVADDDADTLSDIDVFPQPGGGAND